MPDGAVPETPKFESPAIESDINRIAGEIARRKESGEAKETDHKELLKQAIQSIAAAPAPQQAQVQSSSNLPAYAEGAAPEVKLEIEYLLDVALKQGIAKANDMAAKSNPFVMDAFHDALAGKLYPELQKRNILK